MKTIKEIAQLVLERRARMNPTVMQGEMLAMLGEDGLSEALNRRWLIPDYDSGYMKVSNQEGTVTEMQELAALPDATPEQDRMIESRNIALQHSMRGLAPLSEATFLSEIAAPGTGRPAPSFSAPQPATPTSSAPPTASSGYGVGDDVQVVENGRSFQGKVKTTNNGKYRISFGGTERPQDRDYSPEELRRIAAGQPGQPGKPV